MAMPLSVSELFTKEPVQWGLRGDPYLWREMKQILSSARYPDTVDALVALIETAFEQLTGYPVSHQDFIYVERYSHGGMSSGHVSPEFWRDTAIPLLRKRYGKTKQINASQHL
jgi:hypothetical protein